MVSTGSSEIDFLTLALGLAGGLVIFLFGMERMTDSLKAMADDGMHRVLGKLTGNRFMGALTGALVTAVIQSSSVTTVLVVGFISAGLLTLAQSVGVIMGANIGTTITAQIIAFQVTDYALTMIAIGCAMTLFKKLPTMRSLGMGLFGLGMVFFGMGQMSEATYPLRSYEPFVEVMQQLTHPLPGVLIGALFTALVQSSSATTGIVIVLASQGFLTLETGIAIALGANIGTCVTALISAAGKPRVALQAAMVHVIFNTIGALIWLPFIPQLAEVVRGFSPVAEGLEGTEKLAQEVPRQIANAHTVVKVATTSVFIWFTGSLAKLVMWMIPIRETPGAKDKLKYLDDSYLEVPPAALDQLRLEIARMGDKTTKTIRLLREVEEEEITRRLDTIQFLNKGIVDYFRRLGINGLDVADQTRRDDLLENCHQIYAIADTMRANLIPLMQRWGEGNFQASPETEKLFENYAGTILEVIEEAVDAVRTGDRDAAASVIDAKSRITKSADQLIKHLGERLVSMDESELTKYRLELEVVEILRRIYYHGKRAAKTVAPEVDESSAS